MVILKWPKRRPEINASDTQTDTEDTDASKSQPESRHNTDDQYSVGYAVRRLKQGN